jgi:hypothetical protein
MLNRFNAVSTLMKSALYKPTPTAEVSTFAKYSPIAYAIKNAPKAVTNFNGNLSRDLQKPRNLPNSITNSSKANHTNSFISMNSSYQSYRHVKTKDDNSNNRFFNNTFIRKIGTFTCSLISDARRALTNTRVTM